ncbi:MAG: hypothetical protein M1420_05985 [Actinobacteria bacterium]|nr:hypothetical protein [Actinomycetota bacterium]
MKLVSNISRARSLAAATFAVAIVLQLIAATAFAAQSQSQSQTQPQAFPRASSPWLPRASSQPQSSTSSQPSIPSYWMATNYGNVLTFGGVPFYGSLAGKKLSSPVTAMATTAGKTGYWLLQRNGQVTAFGSARFLGSMAGKPLRHPAVAMASDPQTGGYWIVTAGGQVFSFNAPFYGSIPANRIPLPSEVTGIAAAPDGEGYWLTDQTGNVYTFGSASFYGSALSKGVNAQPPIVAIKSTPDGKGYWLTTAGGQVIAFGDAQAQGQFNAKLSAPIASMAVTPGGNGYWLAMTNGGLLNFGTAQYGGSAGGILAPGMTVVSVTEGPGDGDPPSRLTYPSGSFGYDISWPQCNNPYPSKPYTIAIVGVTGGTANSQNPCLASEASWAGYAHENYINVNIPSTSGELGDTSGPFGNCPQSSGNWYCEAANFGWAAAQQALSFASSSNASSPVWWLDVEVAGGYTNSFPSNGNGTWSSNQNINMEVIRGMLLAFKAAGVTPGIYSTYVQWPSIAGTYAPGGPLWVAGAYDSSWQNHCSSPYVFAGGSPTLVQGTAGPNNTVFDEDYAC